MVTTNKPSISLNPENKRSLLLKNIADPGKLSFKCENIEYSLYSSENTSEYTFEFETEPVDGDKIINMSYDGEQISGLPMFVEETMPTFSHFPDENMITLNGVEDPNKLSLSSSSSQQIDYDIYDDASKDTTYHLQYKNPKNLKREFNVLYNKQMLNKDPISIGSVEQFKPNTLITSSRTPKAKLVSVSKANPSDILLKSQIGTKNEFGELVHSSVERTPQLKTYLGETESDYYDVDNFDFEDSNQTNNPVVGTPSREFLDSDHLGEVRMYGKESVGKKHSEFGTLMYSSEGPHDMSKIMRIVNSSGKNNIISTTSASSSTSSSASSVASASEPSRLVEVPRGMRAARQPSLSAPLRKNVIRI